METQQLYLISDDALRYLKVGISKHPCARLKFIQAHCPLKLKIITTIPDGRRLEYGIHTGLRGLALNGEWYPLEGDRGREVKAKLCEALGKTADDFFVEN